MNTQTDNRPRCALAYGSALSGLENCPLHRRTPFGMTNVSMTQFSIARHSMGCTLNGDHYIYVPPTDELIRADVLKWKKKHEKAKPNTRDDRRRATAFPLATGYRLLSATKDHKLKNPACPYCGGKLSFSINGCELDEATGWFATDIDINCDTEPDIDGPDWEGWWADHSYDNCEKWHTLHERVVASLKRTHRVNDNDTDQQRRAPGIAQ